MIRVKIFRNKDSIRGFEVKGHAEYAAYGQDIVCAAISVLSITTLNSLIEICGIDKERLDYRIDEETGFVDLHLPRNLSEEIFNNSQIVLRAFELGVKSIEESYPNNVTLME